MITFVEIHLITCRWITSCVITMHY